MSKPRASKMGHYMSCPAALYYDMQNQFRKPEPWRNKYTSFGTIVHWRIQEMLGCDLSHATPPADEDYIEAEDMLPKADAATTNAVEELRKYYDLPWLAEQELENDAISGHVDLRFSGVLIDIKTASRVPARQQITPAHYWQLLAYHWLTDCTDLRILYVNSKAEWVVLSESIDVECERTQQDLQRMKRLANKPIPAAVYGSACTDCIHCEKCRDSAIPRIGDPTEARKLEIRGGALCALQ